MRFLVVLSNNSNSALYVRKLKETTGYKYILIVDQILQSDFLLEEFDNQSESEIFAETHYL